MINTLDLHQTRVLTWAANSKDAAMRQKVAESLPTIVAVGQFDSSSINDLCAAMRNGKIDDPKMRVTAASSLAMIVAKDGLEGSAKAIFTAFEQGLDDRDMGVRHASLSGIYTILNSPNSPHIPHQMLPDKLIPKIALRLGSSDRIEAAIAEQCLGLAGLRQTSAVENHLAGLLRKVADDPLIVEDPRAVGERVDRVRSEIKLTKEEHRSMTPEQLRNTSRFDDLEKESDEVMF